MPTQTLTAPIVFLDTETCGLGLDDPIWEIALIRREPDGVETRHHFFVEHDAACAETLPDPFRSDHDQRYATILATSLDDLNVLLRYLLRPGPDGAAAHIVGMCPWFDMDRIEHQITGSEVPWHFHLLDVEAMAYAHHATLGHPAATVPWSSNDLLSALGITVRKEDRHTAMYDAELARAAFDHLTTPAPMPREDLR